MRPVPFDRLDAFFVCLLVDRLTVKTSVKRAGIGYQTARRWLRRLGITIQFGKLGGMPATICTRPPAPTGRRSYRHLTFEDRMTIQAGVQSNPPLSTRSIATQLWVHYSTVARELQRHRFDTYADSGPGAAYSAAAAHTVAAATQVSKKHRSKRLDNPCIRAHVIDGLNDKCSPQQVAGRLRREYPDRKDLHVSHETIYQALYLQGAGSLRHELAVVKALRSGRASRKPQSKLPRRSNRPWLEGARLVDRPPVAADRAVPGHWEGDLVVDNDTGGLVTVIERRSRFCLVRKLPDCRDSQTVTGLVTEMIKSLPEALFETLTWDQGQEMAEHARITVATDCGVYFCDPHSPWQRPTNENTNGLVRDYFPKGTRFDESVSDDDVQAMQDQLNRRPRKVLEYATPAEVLAGIVLADVD